MGNRSSAAPDVAAPWTRAWPLMLVATLAAACTTTPTAPSDATGSGALTIAVTSQDPRAVPAAIVPTPPQALGATRFLAFGDSITWGQLSSFDNGFLYRDEPGSYPTLLRQMLNQYNAPQAFTVINEGVPGESARDGIDRLPGVLNQYRPQVVMLLEGINDMNFGATANQTAANVHFMVQIARLYNCTVLVATMPQTYASTYPNGEERDQSADKIVPFNNQVKSLVSGMQNVHVVDVYQSFGSNRSYMGNDGLHPSSSGYQRMAQLFHARISEIFPVRGSLQ